MEEAQARLNDCEQRLRSVEQEKAEKEKEVEEKRASMLADLAAKEDEMMAEVAREEEKKKEAMASQVTSLHPVAVWLRAASALASILVCRLLCLKRTTASQHRTALAQSESAAEQHVHEAASAISAELKAQHDERLSALQTELDAARRRQEAELEDLDAQHQRAMTEARAAADAKLKTALDDAEALHHKLLEEKKKEMQVRQLRLGEGGGTERRGAGRGWKGR